MIPFIRSFPELMALTEFRASSGNLNEENKIYSSIVDSGQRKRYIRSLEENEVELPNLPKIIKRKWEHNKNLVSRFLDELDTNNQIQPTYDLTLLEGQNRRNHKDAA